MHVSARQPEDIDRLQELIRKEPDARQRDRYRAALLAVEGHATKAIIDKLGRSRDFVQTWAYAYRDGGVEVISDQHAGRVNVAHRPPVEGELHSRSCIS